VSAPKATKRKPGILLALANAITDVARQFVDIREWHGRRIAAVEDRLAKLDQGDGAVAARRTALVALRLHRAEEGRPMPESITLPKKPQEGA
jgi:hypothetical protein